MSTKLSPVVKQGRSQIDSTGLFLNGSFKAGQEIGEIPLGPAVGQGKHTLLVGDQHRLVDEPWRYMNHACSPTARVRFTSNAAFLVAQTDLEPGSELTIDYRQLPEDVSIGFACRCAKCLDSEAATSVGAGALG
jgi:SET domain-containing protein